MAEGRMAKSQFSFAPFLLQRSSSSKTTRHLDCELLILCSCSSSLLSSCLHASGIAIASSICNHAKPRHAFATSFSLCTTALQASPTSGRHSSTSIEPYQPTFQSFIAQPSPLKIFFIEPNKLSTFLAIQGRPYTPLGYRLLELSSSFFTPCPVHTFCRIFSSFSRTASLLSLSSTAKWEKKRVTLTSSSSVTYALSKPRLTPS